MSFLPSVLMVVRPPIELYPPSMSQAEILHEAGFDVHVICRSISGYGDFKGQSVFTRHTTPEGKRLGAVARAVDFFRFCRRARSLIRSLRPSITIAYDSEACVAVGRRPFRVGSKLVWHLHETPEPQTSGYMTNFANGFVRRYATIPNMTVFPDPGRAAWYSDHSGFPLTSMLIVPNCPRPMQIPARRLLRESLRGLVDSSKKIMLYHGAIGPDHALEEAIRSIPYWPQDAVFVLKGREAAGYRHHLLELSGSLSVGDRIFFVDQPFMAYDQHLACVAEADVAWTVIEDTCANWRNSAYASNKRFECMALGVPQITNSDRVLMELIEGSGVGFCVDANDPQAVAIALKQSLDPEIRIGMSGRARALHETRFNYDIQFAPILSRLKWMIGATI